MPLRETLERHLRPVDLPADKRGPRGAIGRALEKAERFRPGFGRKHKEQADADYVDAKRAGNSERDAVGSVDPGRPRRRRPTTGRVTRDRRPARPWSPSTAHPTLPDVGVFAVAAAIILAGAVGVVVARNPVHSALMLVMTLFGVAVMFVLQQANFLAAVQVIVYAGAIVVLFLFVIMFLGVDREEDIATEPLRGQRPLAIGARASSASPDCCCWARSPSGRRARPSVSGSDTGAPNVNLLGKSVYTTYLFPFEATSGPADHRRGRRRGAGPPPAGHRQRRSGRRDPRGRRGRRPDARRPGPGTAGDAAAAVDPAAAGGPVGHRRTPTPGRRRWSA